jgi:dienelactone hydrolase
MNELCLPRARTATSTIALAVIGSVALAQEADAEWKRMQGSKQEVTSYLQRAAKVITDGAKAELASRESWEKVRSVRLDEMRDMIGLLPWPERTPLNARITGKFDKGTYTVEKLAFESLPRVYVTANLYVPKQRSGRVPAIVYVCGHGFLPQGPKAQYQRHGISFAKNGYVALIIDPIQIAETFSLHHGIHNQEMFDWYARGYTPAGPEVWNAMRAIDYLETRPEVDRGRIGMTGRSGGAAMSWFTAAVDPRVKAVMPVMGISTYEANVNANTQRLHCDCMFAINTHLQDMMHQAALIAPRPLLMSHGRKDALFPVPGFTDVETTIEALYRSYGRADDFANIVVETGHQDSDYLRNRSDSSIAICSARQNASSTWRMRTLHPRASRYIPTGRRQMPRISDCMRSFCRCPSSSAIRALQVGKTGARSCCRCSARKFSAPSGEQEDCG